MDDLPSAPEGSISEVEKEIQSVPTAPQQQKVDVPTGHDSDKARKIEAAFNIQDRTDELKQKASEEGKELARRSQEVSQLPPQPIQEVPKPIAPIENHTEGLGSQTQPGQQREHTQSQPQIHPLAEFGLATTQQRAILREKLRAENGEVKKTA